LLQPLQLLAAEVAEAAGLQVDDVDQPDEVRSLVVEAVPAGAPGPLAVAGAVLPAVVAEDVVLAGDVEDLLHARALEHLVAGVELLRFRQVRDVAGVDQEVGRRLEGVDAGDRLPERAGDVGVLRLVEADVAVADLREMELTLRRAAKA